MAIFEGARAPRYALGKSTLGAAIGLAWTVFDTRTQRAVTGEHYATREAAEASVAAHNRMYRDAHADVAELLRGEGRT